MASPATFIFCLKLVLLTAGSLSIFMAVKFSAPLIMGFCLNDVPVLWNSLQTLLKPPYLYLIFNGIIVTIVASSRFNHQHNNHHHHQPVNIPADGRPPVQLITIRTPPQSDVVATFVVAEALAAEEDAAEEDEDYEGEEEARVVELRPVVVNGIKQLEAVDHQNHDHDDEVANDGSWIVPKSDFTPSQEIASIQDETLLDFVSLVKDKPLVLSRLGDVSKPPLQGGRAVKAVSRGRRQQPHHDSLENTWKMITATRQMQKCDTWQNHGREVVVNSLDLDFPPPPPPPRQVPKSATFRDRTNYYRDGPKVSPGMIRKEPSLSQDELNRRAEAFIKKFNEDMRLQRQKSLDKYLEEMINRGA